MLRCWYDIGCPSSSPGPPPPPCLHPPPLSNSYSLVSCRTRRKAVAMCCDTSADLSNDTLTTVHICQCKSSAGRLCALKLLRPSTPTHPLQRMLVSSPDVEAALSAAALLPFAAPPDGLTRRRPVPPARLAGAANSLYARHMHLLLLLLLLAPRCDSAWLLLLSNNWNSKLLLETPDGVLHPFSLCSSCRTPLRPLL